jgi:hypothetical protein
MQRFAKVGNPPGLRPRVLRVRSPPAGESEMGSEAAEKRAQILNKAIRLLRERFSSKEALMAECVEHAMRQETFEVLEPIGTSSESKANFIRSYLCATGVPGKFCASERHKKLA